MGKVLCVVVLTGFTGSSSAWNPHRHRELAPLTQWPCSTQPIEPCFKHHGRLSSQNGIALKIWLIGTKRVVGLDNDSEQLPAPLPKYLEMTSPDHSYIYGDFEICPTEHDTPGHLRRACVRGAEKLVVQDVAGSRPPFRIRSTWPGMRDDLDPGSAAGAGLDFTGRWILESPSQPDPGIPTVLSVRQSLASTNVRGEPMQPFFKDITIERQFETGTRSETHEIGVIGGTVPGLGADGMTVGPRHHHAVSWDANDLVFASGSYTGANPENGDWTERREVWTLDPDGRLHVVITTRSAAGPRTVSSVYRRR